MVQTNKDAVNTNITNNDTIDNDAIDTILGHAGTRQNDGLNTGDGIKNDVGMESFGLDEDDADMKCCGHRQCKGIVSLLLFFCAHTLLLAPPVLSLLSSSSPRRSFCITSTITASQNQPLVTKARTVPWRQTTRPATLTTLALTPGDGGHHLG